MLQEWARHVKRHEVFGVAIPEEKTKTMEGILHTSRVTITEYHLLHALVLASSPKPNNDVAKATVNGQVQNWGPPINISHTDIQPKLWLCCQHITQGKSFPE